MIVIATTTISIMNMCIYIYRYIYIHIYIYIDLLYFYINSDRCEILPLNMLRCRLCQEGPQLDFGFGTVDLAAIHRAGPRDDQPLGLRGWAMVGWPSRQAFKMDALRNHKSSMRINARFGFHFWSCKVVNQPFSRREHTGRHIYELKH